MIVTRENFPSVITELAAEKNIAFDTETYGLGWNDDLFGISMSTRLNDYYFNFQLYGGDESTWLLKAYHLRLEFGALFNDKTKNWFAHNAKFDMRRLAISDAHISGRVIDTQVLCRLEYNNWISYTLDECGRRIAMPKDDTVERYIKDHKLYKMVKLPGKKTKEKEKYYNKIPLEIIAKYAMRDSRVCYALGMHYYEHLIKE